MREILLVQISETQLLNLNLFCVNKWFLYLIYLACDVSLDFVTHNY